MRLLTYYWLSLFASWGHFFTMWRSVSSNPTDDEIDSEGGVAVSLFDKAVNEYKPAF